MWAVFALLSAVFAALTGILAKLGMEGINSNLATAIRTAVEGMELISKPWLELICSSCWALISILFRNTWTVFSFLSVT